MGSINGLSKKPEMSEMSEMSKVRHKPLVKWQNWQNWQNWHHWTQHDTTGLSMTPLVSTGLSMTPLVSTGLHWSPLDSTGLHWTAPDSTGQHRTTRNQENDQNHEISRKWPKSWNFPKMTKNTVKHGKGLARTRTAVGYQGSHHPAIPHYPGYTPPPHHCP